MKLTRKQLIFNAIFCLTLLIVIIWALYAEYNRPWKKYQKGFYKLTKSPPFNSPLGKGGDRGVRGERIQQLWLQELGEVDRCITCHQGVDNPEFKNAAQPFRTHSGDYLKYHPVEKYGCVVCHAGQGAALTVNAAHGEVKNWTKPLLKNHYVQSSCGRCHGMGQEVPLNTELAGAPVFIEGWKLFMEYNCIGCHKLTGYKRPERIAPALTSVGSKVNRDWLISWLKNPKDYFPKTKMPRFTLSDEEIGCIVDYLMSLNSFQSTSNPPLPPFAKVGNTPLNPLLLEGKSPSLFLPLDKGRIGGVKGGIGGFSDEGKRLISELGCLGCHAIGENGNNFAPPFSGIGNKVKPDWLYPFLKKPKSYDAKTIIPDFTISEKEIPVIAAYLMSLKKDNRESENKSGGTPDLLMHGAYQPVGQASRLSENIAKGKKLVKDLGCTGCHEIEKFPPGYDAPQLDGIGDKRVDELVFGNITGIDKTLINWLRIKVMDPKRFATDKIVTRMPGYDFNEEQAEALVTFLLSIRKDSLPSKYIRVLADPNKAGVKGKKVVEKYNCLGCHLINKEGGNIGPELTREAKKSRQEWLFAFLKNPVKIRPEPILKAKMPNFNLSDKKVDTIIEYFASVSEEPYPYSFELKKEIYSDDIRNGEKLYQEIFACSACHIVNGHGGQIGPEHTDLSSRLRREWIEQWLKNPRAMQIDVRMPRFTFKDWEFEALTNYLMTLGSYRFVKMKNVE